MMVRVPYRFSASSIIETTTKTRTLHFKKIFKSNVLLPKIASVFFQADKENGQNI
jgi:hypothetical protein